ncbi:CIR protein PIR protein [Plasmodium vinckei vinckei]|uniref:CIR protein PIR protein n=1 Tax=Plasmodium vinckei vinckei TaxID=54757 RepID=A0A449BX59_PLAVN|nr:CIR protein PIR protein [Plasmodium vinckei vinckei]VEV58067.1 CIR protein PIR protein [Plasmodium vinckei vinckei]
MASSPYNIEDVYKEFVTISGYFGEEKTNSGSKTQVTNGAIHNYCHYGDTPGKGNCSDYFQMVSSGVIHLLNNLKGKNVLDYDKLAEYAILWLSYKLYIKENNTARNLNDFYNSYIETNKDYNKNIKDTNLTYKAIIDKKKDLMDNNEISKFDAPFNILYFLYYEISDEHPDCNTNLSIAKNFAEQFEKLNNDSNINGNTSYSKLLSTLSDDYNILKNKCPKFQSLSEIKRSQSSAENSVEAPGKVSGQPTALIPEGTSSSSSILNTVIPGLSTFAIPIFLVVAYKTIYKKKNKKSKEENET